jgi:hypothetical protein
VLTFTPMRCFPFFLLIPVLAAQSADRTVPAQSPAPRLIVRVLQPFAPAPDQPQAGREKFHAYVSSTVGVLPLLGEATNAAISFGLGTPREWEQDLSGYGKRFGNNMAYNAIRTSVTYPTSLLFREDNRYFASGKSGVSGRILFAATSPFRTRRPNGKYSFSFSTTTGIVTANLVTNTWAPPSWQGPGRVARNIGLSYAGISGLNVFREFVPDLIRRFRR